MQNWNYEQEVTPEAEDSIIREVFPELSGEAEAERSHYGNWRGQRVHPGAHHQAAYRRNNLRYPVHGRVSSPVRRDWRNRGWNAGHSSVGGVWGNRYYRQGQYGWNAPYGSPQWAQAALGQTIGPWVGNSGQMDSLTRRALRIFQSRYSLPVTGGLDNDTLQALLNAVNQAPPTADTPADTPQPDSAAPPDAAAPAAASPADASAPANPQPATGEFEGFFSRNRSRGRGFGFGRRGGFSQDSRVDHCALCQSLGQEFGLELG